jgi:hypothetical protein
VSGGSGCSTDAPLRLRTLPGLGPQRDQELGWTAIVVALLMLERMRQIDVLNAWATNTFKKYGPYLRWMKQFGVRSGVHPLKVAPLTKPPDLCGNSVGLGGALVLSPYVRGPRRRTAPRFVQYLAWFALGCGMVSQHAFVIRIPRPRDAGSVLTRHDHGLCLSYGGGTHYIVSFGDGSAHGGSLQRRAGLSRPIICIWLTKD